MRVSLSVCLLAFVCLQVFPSSITIESSAYALWNVGQGQWFTWIKTHECIHVDIGGDRLDANTSHPFCKHKKNQLIFTHFDWDHIGGAKKLRQRIGDSKHFCIFLYPGQTVPQKKQSFINGLQRCPHSPSGIDVVQPRQTRGLDSNDSGLIFLVNKEILIPGDQSTKNEHLWVSQLPSHMGLGLIVPHHGSRGSSGKKLLGSVKLKWAWVSARKSRYNHPHADTRARYRLRGIPFVSTETMGHLLMPATHQGL